MSHHYNPRKVLRQVSNSLLRQFFAKSRKDIDVEWDTLAETDIESIYRAWQAMKDADRRVVEAVMQDVNAMATEEGVKVLVRDGDTWGKNLREDLDQWESRYDKAMWAYLNHQDVWKMAVLFARADQLEGTRPWVKRSGVSTHPAKTEEADIGGLQNALKAFYRDREGRGHCCRVNHMLRNKRQDYFFVSLSDYTDTYDKLDTEKHDFVRESEQRAFEVVFVYEQQTGSLDVYAKGGKKVVTPLQEVFARVILGVELGEEVEGQPYHLAELLNPKFGFSVEAGDGVDHVRLRRVRLSVKGNRKRRITLEANPDGSADDIHTMIQNYLNQQTLPPALVDVDLATITFRMAGGNNGRATSFSFNLSYPDGCSLKSLREEHRVLGEKYLKKWKIDVG